MSILQSLAFKKPNYTVFLTFFMVLLVATGCDFQDRQATAISKGLDESLIDSVNDSLSAAKAAPVSASANTKNLGSFTVDEILKRMTLREKIGQLFFVRARGYFQSESSEEYRELLKKIKGYKVGGLIFFKGNVYGQAVLTNKLQKESRIPLWITQDMEFGAAMRVKGTTRITPAMGIAATGNANYAYRAGQITGREAKALGVNQIFGPVLDVNNNPENPVINVRSFSGDPQTVADFGTRFIAGVSSEGVIPTAKHFPGHGDTDTDSHYSLPIIKADYARLDSVELVPFKAAIRVNVPSIMSAHINFPEISQNPGRPSTLDRSVLERILVDSLGFKGLVVTDGLEMQGIAANYTPGQAIRYALEAGADVMLLSPDELKAIDELVQAVNDSTIAEERINKSVRKLLKWKKEAGLFKNATIDVQKLSASIHSRKSRLIADIISRESLTLLKNENNIIPIQARRYPRILVLSIANDYSGETGEYLARQVRRYHPTVRFEVFDERTGSEEERNILRDAHWADLIIIGSYARVDRRNKNQFSDRQHNFLNKLPGQTPQALIALGNPYVVSDLPRAEVQLLAWDDSEEQVRNTVPALFGLSAIAGKLPINIPGMYQMGHGLSQPRATRCFDAPEAAGLSPEKLQKVDTILKDAIKDSTFPGGVVAVVKDDILAYCNAFGYHTYHKAEQVAPNDVYDLASLTKVAATTASVMKLIDEAKISLDDPVSNYFAEFNEGSKNAITIRHLLLHTSGLPAFRVYVDSLKSRNEILEAIKNEPLINEPGTEYVYSDLGFILLGQIVQQQSGLPLNEYAKKMFYKPLGMESTRFNPKQAGNRFASRIPPTEIDEMYRNKTVQAEVHDERAWFLGGVAGHAGLFSNVQDLSIFAQMLLNEGSYAGKQYIRPETIRAFTAKQSQLHNRGYGFDRKSDTGFSTAGSLTGNRTFGHLGFTGTSLWMDPEKNIAIILLTNRTYPKRTYGKNISKIRAEIADAVISSIESQ
jgi:beta-glucosidase-like glycosyl hydrolase/CubicO group peptidase (beta-lactamase class C family)